MLIDAIGGLLPSAIGVALSPVSIIAVILMLGTPKARTNGPAFAVGWVLGMVAVSVIVLLVAGGADEPGSSTSDGVNWVTL
ncbi:MAG: GAP family protein, partial [Acidimicrobiia bacterium]